MEIRGHHQTKDQVYEGLSCILEFGMEMEKIFGLQM